MSAVFATLRWLLVGLGLTIMGGAIFAAYRMPDPAVVLGCGPIGTPCETQGRSYHVLLPEREGPFPVVLFFHGSTATGAHIIGHPAIGAPMVKRGYAIVAPDALDIDYAGGQKSSGWVFPSRKGARNDNSFVRQALDDAARRFPLDTGTLLVAGHSRGASFAWYVACSRTDPRFRAVAPLSGALVRDNPLSCGSRPPPFHMLHTHGDVDPTYPSHGTGPSGGWPGWLGAEDSLEILRRRFRCRRAGQDRADAFQLTRWEGCAPGASLTLALFSGGHGVPAGWSDLALDWFEALALAPRP